VQVETACDDPAYWLARFGIDPECFVFDALLDLKPARRF
jgi:hypothetical protein